MSKARNPRKPRKKWGKYPEAISSRYTRPIYERIVTLVDRTGSELSDVMRDVVAAGLDSVEKRNAETARAQSGLPANDEDRSYADLEKELQALNAEMEQVGGALRHSLGRLGVACSDSISAITEELK